MHTSAMKITSKGQVTIPKSIRDLLKTDVVVFNVIEGNVVIMPVGDVGGTLHEYARPVKKTAFKEIKDRAWSV